ncbi:hypothetical protein C5167_030876, partial [Papaver somniferum]
THTDRDRCHKSLIERRGSPTTGTTYHHVVELLTAIPSFRYQGNIVQGYPYQNATVQGTPTL